MADVIEEVTKEGLRLPRRLLEEWGYTTGRRMRITSGPDGLHIRPAEADSSQIASLAQRYLLEEVGDMAGIRAPEWISNRWRVAVVLRPEGTLLGELLFSSDGTLLAADSTSPARLTSAADAA